MAKKATTIVLVIVVLLLLGSTIYVSIILTSDNGTAPTPSKASEITDATPVTAISTEPTIVPVDNPDGESGGLAVPTTDPTTDATAIDSTVSPTPSEQDLLAYANPSVTGTQTTPQLSKAVSASPTSTPAAEDLPNTGLGQATKVPTPSITVMPTTMQVKPTQQPMPTALPVAGSSTGPIAAFAVAGLTILAAFFF